MNSRILVSAAMLIVGVAVGFMGARTYERSQSARLAEAVANQVAADERAMRLGAEQWASSLAQAKGEAAIKAFVAGLAPVILSGRAGSLDIAGTSLLRLNGIKAVTILRKDGKTLYASDAKLTVSNAGNDQTKWALMTTDFVMREGIQANLTDMALPVTDRGTVLAIVWMEYDSVAIREEHRPEALAASQP
jgi:hypothetical protein